MKIENQVEQNVPVDSKTLREAFASINALKFVLELNGSLDSSIDKDRLITCQANLILKDVRDILPDLDGIRVNGIVVFQSDCKEDREYNVLTLENVEESLFDKGKEQGIIKEIKTTGYSSDG